MRASYCPSKWRKVFGKLSLKVDNTETKPHGAHLCTLDYLSSKLSSDHSSPELLFWFSVKKCKQTLSAAAAPTEIAYTYLLLAFGRLAAKKLNAFKAHHDLDWEKYQLEIQYYQFKKQLTAKHFLKHLPWIFVKHADQISPLETSRFLFQVSYSSSFRLFPFRFIGSYQNQGFKFRFLKILTGSFTLLRCL